MKEDNIRKLLAHVLIITLVFSMLILGCGPMAGRRREVPKIEMVVENTLPIRRTDEFVVLRVADLKQFAPDFSQNTFIILDPGANKEVPYQLDDMDNDGEGDEIALILDMEPGEKKRLEIRYSPEGRSVTLGHERRTRSAVHPEYEGIGWESELIAYRIYPDHRNSISVFGKSELGLSLDKFADSTIGENAKGFNNLESWGVNILDGGNSFGCGGFGLWDGSKVIKPVNVDALSIAKLDDQVGRYMWVIADGPIRSVIQVIYDKWRIGDQSLRITSTYTIFAGQRWSSGKLKIEGAKSPVKVAVGLAKSQSAPITKNIKNGLFYTWGSQSQLNPPDDMGMALIYPIDSFDSFHETDQSYLAVLNPNTDNEINYWFLCAWNRGDIGVKNNADFSKLVSLVEEGIRNPLTVTIMPVKSKEKQQTPAERTPRGSG